MKRLMHRPKNIAQCYNIGHLRQLAQRNLPSPLFHYLDGGADDEVTLRRNTEAFDDYVFLPRSLSDVSTVDLTIRLLGKQLALPFICAPTGMSRLFHHKAEPAVARAAARAGTFYSLSAMATTTLETIATASEGPKIFQVYLFKDRGLTQDFVARCKAANYDALCLTIDTPVAGNRERDRITGMEMPTRFTLASAMSFVTHPSWSLSYFRNRDFDIKNVIHRVDGVSSKSQSVIDYVNSQFDRTISWNDVARLREDWGGPFIVKGVQSEVDAKRAVAAGASAIMISNHGGRQLDGTMAPIDLIETVRQEVGNAVELILDGGVRRGSHILKAIARGASACSIGRAYLYGLAAGGEAGVDHVFALLRTELERDMTLLGVAKISEITGDLIRRLERSQLRQGY